MGPKSLLLISLLGLSSARPQDINANTNVTLAGPSDAAVVAPAVVATPAAASPAAASPAVAVAVSPVAVAVPVAVPVASPVVAGISIQGADDDDDVAVVAASSPVPVVAVGSPVPVLAGVTVGVSTDDDDYNGDDYGRDYGTDADDLVATVAIPVPAGATVVAATVAAVPIPTAAPLILADAVTLSNQAAPGLYNVTAAVSPFAPGRTLYIPQGFANGTSIPIFAWENGFCAVNGLMYRDFLTEIASNGYLVIAPGVGKSYTRRGRTDSSWQEESIKSAIRWAKRTGYPVNWSKIAVGGHSCGGSETAETLANDSEGKIATGIIFSGAASNDTLDHFAAPSLWVTGGVSDPSSPAGVSAYAHLSTANRFIPTVAASINAAHKGTFWTGTRGGAYAEIAVRWLDAWTKASQPALDFFAAGAGAAATGRGWTVAANSLPTVARPSPMNNNLY